MEEVQRIPLDPSVSPYGKRDEIAAFMYQAVAFIDRPFWVYTEKCIRSVGPILQSDDQFDSRAVEIFFRIVYLFLLPVMIPLSLVLTAISSIPRALANMVGEHPFIYLKGKLADKVAGKDEKISIFNWNLCFVAGFPRVYGGVLPWRYRVDKVVSKIRQEDPDIVCLQEVNDLDAAYCLYDKLKDEYAHFYINIGPQFLTQNSGLFVASKYKIENPHFVPFGVGRGSQKMVNKGFFDFDIISQGRVISHLITTHLPPSKDDFNPTDEEKKARREAIDVIMGRLNSLYRGDNILPPVILVGDMNLEWSREDGEEYLNSKLKRQFYDKRNDGREQVDNRSTTAITDFLIKYVWTYSQGERDKQRFTQPMIIDYALLYNNGLTAIVETKIVEGFDVASPIEALSDHHGLYTTIKV